METGQETFLANRIKKHFAQEVSFYDHPLDDEDGHFYDTDTGKWLGKPEYRSWDMRDVMLFFSEVQRAFMQELLHMLSETSISQDEQVSLAWDFLRKKFFDQLGISRDGPWYNKSLIEAQTWTQWGSDEPDLEEND